MLEKFGDSVQFRLIFSRRASNPITPDERMPLPEFRKQCYSSG
jgi:hypothetical protein